MMPVFDLRLMDHTPAKYAPRCGHTARHQRQRGLLVGLLGRVLLILNRSRKAAVTPLPRPKTI